MFAHWLAKHRCREKVDADCGHPTAAQIRNEHEFVRELSATLEHADRVVITKMMKRQGAENDVIWLRWSPFQDVSFDETDFRIRNAQFLRDLESRGLSIQRIDSQFRPNLAPALCDQTRNIARAGGKIDNSQARVWLDPAAEKHRNQRVTPKPAIELPDIFKIPLQFRGNRLRTVHQLELDWIKLPLH